MIARVILAPDLHDRLIADAAAAFPCECCGLIEGVREIPPPLAGEVLSRPQAGRGGGGQIDACMWGHEVRALAVHPTHNLAMRPDRFEIDPAAHIALLRRLRGTGRDIVGCYHSHPNGAAGLSDWDRDGAFDEDFLWLVIAVTASGPIPGRHWERAHPCASQRIPALHRPMTPEDGRAPGKSSPHANQAFEAKLAAFVFDADGPRGLPICAAAP